MNRKNFYFLSILLTLWMMIPSISHAVVYTDYFNNSSQPINLTGPADQYQFGTVVLNSGSNTLNKLCGSDVSGVKWDLAKITITSEVPWTGRVVEQAAFYPKILYATNLDGFAFVPLYISPYFNGSTATATTGGVGLSVPPGTNIAWTGNLPDAQRRTNGFSSVRSQLYIYKDAGRPVTSQSIIQGVTLYRYDCYDTNGVIQETAYIKSYPITVNTTVSACVPTNSTIAINMDGILASTLENAGDSTLIGTKSKTFSLTCDPNVSVYYSVVDLSDQSNTSTMAKLTGDSTAKGVGFAVTSGSTRLQFGPDGSAAGIPNQKKYYISASGTAGGTISHILGFSYVRDTSQAVKVGTAKAILGITYSYQ